MRSTDHTHPRLDAYLDGEMTRGEAQAVEAHLATCLPCRQSLLDARLLAEALGAPDPALPPGFAARIRDRAVGSRLPAPPLWWVSLPPMWRAGVAATFVFAVLAGSWLGQALSPRPTPEVELVAALNAPETAAMLVKPDAGRSGSGVQP